nr:immune inhibitor A [Bdellovibrionales bacterium]
VYSTEIAWVGRGDSKCLTPEKTEEGMGEDDYQNDFNRAYRTKKNSPRNKMLNTAPLKDTAEPILKYKVVQNEMGAFGYIRLESFVPEKLTTDEVILEVKKILLKDFAKTDGLIFDLRNNGGGYIYLAEALVQLFTPKNTLPLNFRLKNSHANRHFMYQSPTNIWAMALKEAEATAAPFTVNMPLNPATELDVVGQYYFKPVALLTNANCYSSCDMFSALMQDHDAAIIFGEDSTTGAGGANNRSHNDTILSLKEDLGPYKKLPSGQDMGFSFRQTIRTGQSEGVFLEDRGVVSDRIVPASLSDLYTDSGDQYKVIAKALIERSNQHTSWVKINEDRLDLLVTDEPKMLIKWMQTDKIEFKVNRRSMEQIAVELDNTIGQSFPFPKLETTNKYEAGEVEIVGAKEGKRVWRKIQAYRLVPQTIMLEDDLLISLESATSHPFAVYNYKNLTDDGWIVQDGTLKTGNSEEYVDSVKTEASLFLQLSETKDFSLNFDAQVNSEKDFDYLRVKLTVEGKDVDLIKGLSGDEEMKTYNFDLSAYKGKKVEIRFIFESDKGVTDKGVVLKNLSVTSKAL